MSKPNLAAEIHELTLSGGVDFHLHSTASDGSEKPANVLRMAREAGLRAFALSDHDTVGGVAEIAAELAQSDPRTRPRFIPAVELSLELDEKKVHLLGYFPDVAHALRLAPWLEDQARKRHERNLRIEACLRREGVPFSLRELSLRTQGQLGRPHIARWLVAHGYAAGLNEAFRDWLGSKGKCFVIREKNRLEEGIARIREAGGVSFVAHPAEEGWCASPELLHDKLGKARSAGADGVEAFHGEATDAERERIVAVARELGFYLSAGSDWHGSNKENTPHYTGCTRFL